jgi:DHA1 family bicyclomycin/chloramphenicol resistance-like MFS transporter
MSTTIASGLVLSLTVLVLLVRPWRLIDAEPEPAAVAA